MEKISRYKRASKVKRQRTAKQIEEKNLRDTEFNYKKGWLRNNGFTVFLTILALIVSVVAIIFSCKSSKRVETLVEAGLYPLNKEFAKSMDLDISKIDDPVLFAEIKIAYEKADRKELRAKLEEYLKISPESGYPYWLLGWYHHDGDTTIIDDPHKAKYYYTKAIDVMKDDHPAKPIAYNNRGKIFSELGQDSLATDDYRKALKLNSKYATAYYNLASNLLDAGSNDSSIVLFSKAITYSKGNDKNLSNSYYHRGMAYLLKEIFDESIKDFNKAESLGMKDYMLYYKRGISHRNYGDFNGALQDHRFLLGFDYIKSADSVNIFINLSLDYLYLGFLDSTYIYLQQAMDYPINGYIQEVFLKYKDTTAWLKDPKNAAKAAEVRARINEIIAPEKLPE